jgi:hypothetical protein
MAALRAYRRARGLCEKWAEKWSRDHKCSEQIQLHALQEIWDLCQLDTSADDNSSQDELGPTDQLMTLSLSPVQGKQCPKTIRFRGTV